MQHFKDPKFKPLYDALPNRVRDVADKNFVLLKHDPKHPSCILSASRTTCGRSASGEATERWPLKAKMDFSGFGIGSHADYDRLVS